MPLISCNIPVYWNPDEETNIEAHLIAIYVPREALGQTISDADESETSQNELLETSNLNTLGLLLDKEGLWWRFIYEEVKLRKEETK